jgi:hypothetical protein
MVNLRTKYVGLEGFSSRFPAGESFDAIASAAVVVHSAVVVPFSELFYV